MTPPVRRRSKDPRPAHLCGPPQYRKRTPRYTRWFVAAGVAAATAVAGSASKAADAVLQARRRGSGASSAKRHSKAGTLAQPAGAIDFTARVRGGLQRTAGAGTGGRHHGGHGKRRRTPATGVDATAPVRPSRRDGRLAETGVPPGLDRSDYVARVTTLQSLAAEAPERYGVDRTAESLLIRRSATRPVCCRHR